MKIAEILEMASEPLISYEIIPPFRGKSAQYVYNIIDELIQFHPPFIDVTSHAAEPVYLDAGGGNYKRKSRRRRPGTIGLCAAIKYRYNVETVPHILCNGFSKQETEDALIELNYLGIDNVLAITGDAHTGPASKAKEKYSNKYSLDLVHQIKRMNDGFYEEDIKDSARTNFCIGVGAYPEKHPDSPSLQQDIRFLKAKVAAGADYIVTQMFFDVTDYFTFVDLCRSNDIQVPIVPGIKLLTRKSQLASLPRHFSVDIPDDLVQAMEKSSGDAECREIARIFHEDFKTSDFGGFAQHLIIKSR